MSDRGTKCRPKTDRDLHVIVTEGNLQTASTFDRRTTEEDARAEFNLDDQDMYTQKPLYTNSPDGQMLWCLVKVNSKVSGTVDCPQPRNRKL